MLRPIDIVVLVGLLTPGRSGSQVELARRLHLSQPSVHRSLKQLARSGLQRGGRARHVAVRELFVHGLRYVYPVDPGAPARGLPTAHAAPSFAGSLAAEQPYVWPCEAGRMAGTSLEPLHPSVPGAALEDPTFYELMAIIDIFRVGRTRERKMARVRLDEILGLGS